MPENSGRPGEENSDPMADLFTKLPDPSKPGPASASAGAAPGSRRAAREAAARAAAESGEQSVAEEPVPQAEEVVAELAAEREAPAVLEELLDTASDIHAHEDARVRRRRRRRGCLISLIILLAIVGGIAVGGVWVMNTYGDRIEEVMGWGEPKDWEPGQAGEPVLITISEGDTGSAVSQTLYEAEVTRTPEALYDYLISEAVPADFHPGVYELRERMSAAEAMEMLQDPASKREHVVLLREGLTNDRSLELISEALGFPMEELEAAVEDPAEYGVDADSLEGWLFPARYDFPPGIAAEEVIARMVDRTRESLRSADVPDERAHEILTIAAIIEREARFEEDFYRVSRVIQNRLQPGNQETFGYLQMDSTAQYGYGQLHDGAAASSREALEDDNPWNTYVHTGLPKGPIANPGDRAIDAAMHPADGPWLYFVTINDATGETEFTETYREHQQAIERRQEWCRADESRCP